MKPKIFAIVDTETVKPNLVYDLGILIMDSYGKVIAQKSWVVRDVVENWELMASGFYTKYMGNYYWDYLKGFYEVLPFRKVRKEVNDFLEAHKVNTVCAYNVKFDLSALAATTKHFTKKDNFFRKKYDILDLWLLACTTICQTPEYQTYVRQHNFISDAGNVKTSAESVYSFLHRQPDYVEHHRAIYDCAIEAEILMAVLGNTSIYALPYNTIDGRPWKHAQNLPTVEDLLN